MEYRSYSDQLLDYYGSVTQCLNISTLISVVNGANGNRTRYRVIRSLSCYLN